MDKNSEAIALWQECFGDSRDWIEKYFEQVLKPEFNVSLTLSDGTICSSLFLLPYKMNFCGKKATLSYISGACTSVNMRHKGYMNRLMHNAIELSYRNGDCFMALLPANISLYGYYDRFGFASVFFINEQRYTSAHNFHGTGINRLIENADTDLLWKYFNKKEKDLNGRVVHNRNDFDNILWDNAYDGGRTVAVCKAGVITGLAFIVPRNEEIAVKELFYDNDAANNDLLEEIKKLYPEKDMVVEVRSGNGFLAMEPYGMLRIINVEKVMSMVAQANPELSNVIKVNDGIIPQNSHTFRIHRGSVEIYDDFKDRINMELDIKTLAEVLFCTPATGKLSGIFSVSPSMGLMLE